MSISSHIIMNSLVKELMSMDASQLKAFFMIAYSDKLSDADLDLQASWAAQKVLNGNKKEISQLIESIYE